MVKRVLSFSLLLALGAAPLWAAPKPEPAPEAKNPPPAAGTEAAPESGQSIDQILEEDEEVSQGSGYTYDPGTRRDPFKSLLAAAEKPQIKGPRPEGIAGLLIDEVDLTGIFRTPRGYVVQIQASNKGKSFLLREGDKLYDGEVIAINAKEVTFKQTVNDPTALKPFREVVKKLNP